MKGKYEELKAKFGPELERIMYRGLRNAGFGAVAGAIGGGKFFRRTLPTVEAAMLGAWFTYFNWLDDIENFEREKLGPAREAAKADCRKQAGIDK